MQKHFTHKEIGSAQKDTVFLPYRILLFFAAIASSKVKVQSKRYTISQCKASPSIKLNTHFPLRNLPYAYVLP
jgi:hypothetical protein